MTFPLKTVPNIYFHIWLKLLIVPLTPRRVCMKDYDVDSRRIHVLAEVQDKYVYIFSKTNNKKQKTKTNNKKHLTC